MIKARASGSKVYLCFMKKGRQARHRIPRNSCWEDFLFKESKQEVTKIVCLRRHGVGGGGGGGEDGDRPLQRSPSK